MERCKLAALRIGTDLLEEEVRALCGAEYSRKGEGQCYRGGSDRTRIIIDGGKFSITRPRVRNETGEVQLDMLDKLQHQDLLDEKMKRAMISGVSSRQYHEVVQGYSDKLSVSKSSVSRAFTRASQKDLDAINGSELSEHSFVALMLDGFEIGGQMIIAALGITNKMEKIPLGLKESSSENAEVTTDLLTSIKERGFTTATSFFLAVIDGSKALRKALRRVFGDRALIQPCWLHKLRNLKKYVPDKLHGTLLWRLKKMRNPNICHSSLITSMEASLLARSTRSDTRTRSASSGAPWWPVLILERFKNEAQIKFGAERYDVAMMIGEHLCSRQPQKWQTSEGVMNLLIAVPKRRGAQGETEFKVSADGDRYFSAPVVTKVASKNGFLPE
jgi:transposase-like protein